MGEVERERLTDQLEAGEEQVETDSQHDRRHDHGRYEEELDRSAAPEPAPREADRRRRAQPRREHHGDGGDPHGKERRPEPLAPTQVVLVPAKGPVSGWELDELGRVERHHDDDDDGRAEEKQREAAVRPEEPTAECCARPGHARPCPVSRSRPSSVLNSTNKVPTTVRRNTPRLAPKFQSSKSRTTSSISVAKVTWPSPPRSAGVM